MSETEYREYRHEDAESFLRLHDTAFPKMSAEFWDRFSHGPVTASVALMDGEVVGTVPFHLRDFRIRPGVVVPVACEFSVCVREDLRGTGIGSGLMAKAKEFLRERCLAMMVYRGDERSPAYHYYARNGHHDMIYLRPWVRRGSTGVDAGEVERRGWEEFLAEEAEHLAVFRNAYAAHGGFPERGSGYYAPAAHTPEYNEVPVELTVLSRRGVVGAHSSTPAVTSLRGYAIVGEERYVPALHLMEIAVMDNDLAEALPLLATFAEMAVERGVPAVASMPDSSPYVPALRALGFEPQPRSQRSMMIMVHALDPEGLASAVWRESEATAGLEVHAWTPERQVVLHRPCQGRAREVLLEMKEAELTRLLFGRLDLRAAVAQGTVTAVGADAADIDAIAGALPFTEWAYHYLDFV